MRVRGSWRPNKTAIYWPPLLWPSTLCLSHSPGLLNRRPRGSALCWMLAFFTASFQQLLWTPTHQGPEGPFGLTWLSLQHLISNFSPPVTPTVCLLSWLSYIIVQRPLSRLLDLWNGMFDRRQAEILSCSSQVTLFRCISLWVYHGNFNLSHFVSQFPPTQFPLITAIRMCHFLPVHHFEWHFLAGSKVKIQHVLKNKGDAAIHMG